VYAYIKINFKNILTKRLQNGAANLKSEQIATIFLLKELIDNTKFSENMVISWY